MPIRTLDSVDVSGKRVLVRVDYNVPLEDGQVTDDTRIQATIPTIRRLLEGGASVVLCSHLGRPKGQFRPELSLRPVAEKLQEILGEPVQFVEDCVGEIAETAAARLESGQILLLENLRFYSEEEANDADFASQLAGLADIYVNDAFGAAHRAHASTAGVASYLPAYAGLLMQREIEALTKVLEEPALPLVLIIGGAKISDKIGVIESFLTRADAIVIGGGMANTFLLADGKEVGSSLAEPDLADTARDLMQRATDSGVTLHLPIDCVVAPSLDRASESRTILVDQVDSDSAIFDIGPQTVEMYSEIVGDAATVVWNGPLGAFETKPFDQGTLGVARAVAGSNAFSVVGGGDSVAALNELGLAGEIDHVSTGGGASLEFLEGEELPGIAVLREDG